VAAQLSSLVRSGTDSGWCRTSAADRRRRACVCNVEARDVVAGDHDDVVLAGKVAVALITNARYADLVRSGSQLDVLEVGLALTQHQRLEPASRPTMRCRSA
jgi:hypothetical protein